MFPPASLLSDFPILWQPVNGRPLVYLDNAATTQKPVPVLDASRHYYERINSNIHRGTHHLARAATEAYEHARQSIAGALNASSPDELIFTPGTTAGINLVANILGLSGKVGPGDDILISGSELKLWGEGGFVDTKTLPGWDVAASQTALPRAAWRRSRC